MTMEEAKGSLDYWRKFFDSAKSNIFELIEKAILVAATDWPKEFNDRKDLIVERLYTSQLSPHYKCNPAAEIHALNNGDDEQTEEEKDSCNLVEKNNNCCVDNDQIVGEVMWLKNVLCNHEDESDSALYESLKSLQLIKLSVETLKETQIGRAVNVLRKHNDDHIRKLALTLINGWKVLVDEWVKSGTAAITKTAATDSEQKPSSSHLSTGVKRMRSEEGSDMSKMEISKRKLHEGYQRIENAKKHRMIQIIEPRDLPKEAIDEKPRQKKKAGNHNGICTHRSPGARR